MTDTVTQETDQGALPDSWEIARLDDMAEITLGQSPPSSSYNDAAHGLPFFQGKAEFGSLYPTVAKWCSEPKKIAEGGDVLLSVRAPVGPTNICPDTACIGRGLAAIRGSGGIETKFILYSLRASQNELASKATGTTFPAVTGNTLNGFTLPLPPLNEQRRIVEKIEELFTKLDAGVRSLEQARAQLKSYRRSVLKAAVEGELSREWREAHGDELEPASEILERILQERREKFAGKKYKEPASSDTSELPALPNGWAWAKTDQLFNFVTSGSRGWAKYYSDEGPTFLRIGNLDHDSISLDLRSIQNVQPPEGTEGTRTRVISGDVLISITADVGMVAVIPPDFEEAYINQHIALARPSHLVNIKYLAWYLVSEPGNKQLTGRRYGATKPGLNLDDIRTVNVPIPPLEEQRIIVEEVERRLSVVDKLEATVEENLKQAGGLRQSILKQAFSGELVPQDPDDEPASVLLERIREERRATKPKAKRGRGAKKDDGAQGRLI